MGDKGKGGKGGKGHGRGEEGECRDPAGITLLLGRKKGDDFISASLVGRKEKFTHAYGLRNIFCSYPSLAVTRMGADIRWISRILLPYGQVPNIAFDISSFRTNDRLTSFSRKSS